MAYNPESLEQEFSWKATPFSLAQRELTSQKRLCFMELLTNSIQHSPSSEAKRFVIGQEIPPILWNPKVHYRIHKCPPPVHMHRFN
jgi:hypothetical protein